MPLEMVVEVTSNVTLTDELAADFQEAYEVLEKLPSNRTIAVNFDSENEARMFVRQGKLWGSMQNPALTFARKGDIKELPKKVSFRIYKPRPPKDEITESTPSK